MPVLIRARRRELQIQLLESRKSLIDLWPTNTEIQKIEKHQKMLNNK